MANGRMLLQAGAQSQAARRVADEIPPVAGVLRDLTTALDSAAPGFVGAASAGLAQAIRTWLEVAGTLPTVLGDYASALAAVDATAVKTDASGARGLTDATSGSTSGSGSGSGLNMGLGAPR